jgi:DNA polymerase
MLVGEQPGNDEDLAGKPFVGPAGALLNQVLEEAGIDRRDVYVTNAVKHFKFEKVKKRRLHDKPSRSEAKACAPWLRAEIEAVKPKLVIALGATAAGILLGPAFRLTQDHGKIAPGGMAEKTMASHHPAAILRAPDPAAREAKLSQLLRDLRAAAKVVRR